MNKEKIKPKELLVLIIVIVLGIGYYLYYKNNSNQTVQNTSYKFDTTFFENQKTGYGLRVIPIDSDGVEAAELTVYFDKSDWFTKIIEVSYGGETFRHQYKYYFFDINDFFIIETFEQWDRPYSEEGRQQTKTETSKYYFNKLFMTQWIDLENNNIPIDSEKFKQKQQEILEQTEAFLNIISTKNP